MDHYSENAAAVGAVLAKYFKGVYHGDTILLRAIFHSAALVSGDVNGELYFKTIEQYLTGVENRESPFDLHEPFRMEILSIEIINTIAVAKVHVPIFAYHYYDLLSLTRIKGEWLIVNKLMTNVN